MNLTVEKLIRKMIYAKAGGHELAYQKAKEQAECEIYVEQRDRKIVSIIKDLKKQKRENVKDYGAPFPEWFDVFILIGALTCVVIPLVALVAVIIFGVRCLIIH